MSHSTTPSLDPTGDRPPRRQCWVPMSLRMFAGVLVALSAGRALLIGVPIYRQQVAIREIERVGGGYTTRPGGPAWLRSWIGDERVSVFASVRHVGFYGIDGDANLDAALTR